VRTSLGGTSVVLSFRIPGNPATSPVPVVPEQRVDAFVEHLGKPPEKARRRRLQVPESQPCSPARVAFQPVLHLLRAIHELV
tara:strand:- start:322 stop:567 length:246 start_codon:yes stop_codon:yes gene_type:complete